MAMAPVSSSLISRSSTEDNLIIGVVTLMEVELVVHRSMQEVACPWTTPPCWGRIREPAKSASTSTKGFRRCHPRRRRPSWSE